MATATTPAAEKVLRRFARFAVVGVIASDWRGADSPFDRVLPLCTGGVTPEYSMTHAAALVRRALLEREL